MNIHILGVCGTFMAGIAVIAKQAGHHVSGSDEKLLPPMSTQLYADKIELYEAYKSEHIDASSPDLVIVGNVIKRGNPALEYLLNNKIPYISGPEWLYREVLSKQTKVLAVAGTHGKTTTTSILTWILEKTGHNPGFLIGGVPENFGFSARLGAGKYFVIEADEYDTAFFDKRSKFVHYHPDVVIINNLEFDHADIFPDLLAIQKQFHQMIRMLPEQAIIIRPVECTNIDDTLKMGCWSKVETFAMDNESKGTNWHADLIKSDGTHFKVKYNNQKKTEQADAHWDLIGAHNVSNAMAAIAVTHALGLPIKEMCEALATFKNVKRRLEIKGCVDDITVYDDFAHHPTAIEATIGALRQHVDKARIFAILHLASNSMRMGIYKDTLGPALKEADVIFVLRPDNADALNWIESSEKPVNIADSVHQMVEKVVSELKPHDHVLVMSNGNFEGIHGKILNVLHVLKLSEANA